MEPKQKTVRPSIISSWFVLGPVLFVSAVVIVAGLVAVSVKYSTRPVILDVEKTGDWTQEQRIATACEATGLAWGPCLSVNSTPQPETAVVVEKPLSQADWCEQQSRLFSLQDSLLYQCKIEQSQHACSLSWDGDSSAGDKATSEYFVFFRFNQPEVRWKTIGSVSRSSDERELMLVLAPYYVQCHDCNHSVVGDLDFRAMEILLAGCQLRLLACGAEFSGLD